MYTQTKKLAFFLVAIVVSAAAQQQTPVTTTGGTTNKVPLFTGTYTVGNSTITQSGSYVGIGTANPQNNLHISGTSTNGVGTYVENDSGSAATGAPFAGIALEQIGTSGWGISGWPNAGVLESFGVGGIVVDAYGSNGGPIALQTNRVTRMTITNPGNVGIGTTTPGFPLTVVGDIVDGSLTAGQSGVVGLLPGGTGSWFWIDNPNANYLRFSNGGNPGSNPVVITNGGSLGVGTTSPGAMLEVNGNVKLTGGSGASITFADGTVQNTAYSGVGGTCGGDYAESVDVSGNRTSYEPGDVLVIDPTAPGKFLKSDHAYSNFVAGVYSTKPGVVGRRQTTNPKTSTTEVPMAMVGIVPTKVSTENGAIKTGDLLVASSTPGRAMKGTDRSLLTGAVVGKALGSLESGTGVIEVLVTLQ
jgi:hypothetical protein